VECQSVCEEQRNHAEVSQNNAFTAKHRTQLSIVLNVDPFIPFLLFVELVGEDITIDTALVFISSPFLNKGCTGWYAASSQLARVTLMEGFNVYFQENNCMSDKYEELSGYMTASA
jgi:hypothetical protein